MNGVAQPVQIGMPPGTTLLVVDDEPLLRRAIRRMLELDCSSIIEASDGEHAIRIIGRDEAHLLDAVLTDLAMPIVSGPELITVLRECRPDLPIVAMSGGVDVPPELDAVPFLHKPFSPEQLVETLAPLVVRSQEMRHRARQARADAAESRSMAARQMMIAREQQAATGELMAALVRLRERMGARNG